MSTIMNSIEESKALQDFRRSIFGSYTGSEIWPQPFLSQLRHLAKGAETTLGVRLDENTRVAFWLRGPVLGHLSCTGKSDADAEIKGWVLRLDRAVQIDVEIKAAPAPWDDRPWASGRILRINGNELLDATPGVPYRDKREAIEEFIDLVLAVFTG